MKKIMAILITALLFSIASVPSFADTILGEEGSGSSDTSSEASEKPTAEDSVLGSVQDDYFGEGDLVPFSEESISKSFEMFKNSLGSVTNIAIYGTILLIGLFAIVEIIRAIAG